MRRWLMVLALVTGLVLAGCGGGGGTSPGSVYRADPGVGRGPIHYVDRFPKFTPNVADENGIIRDANGTIVFVPQPYPAAFDWQFEGWPPPAPTF